MQNIKCVTVGDGWVGKSSMLIRFINDYFTPGEIKPEALDTFASTVDVDGRQIRLELWDTAGQEDYNRLRAVFYRNIDINVVLLCFSVACPNSFENVKLKWIPELKDYCKNAKILLIGTKLDSLEDPGKIEMLKARNEKPIAYIEGVLLAKKIGAVEYLECSALKNEGIKEVFDAAVNSVLNAPKTIAKKKYFCSIS